MECQRRYHSAIFLILMGFLLPTPATYAQSAASEHYRIDQGTVTVESSKVDITAKRLEDLMGTTDGAVFKLKGMVIHSGWKDTLAATKFSFSLSPQSLDYGSLRPGSIITKNLNLTMHTDTAIGYQLFIAQDHPLQTISGKQVPGTSCDDPQQPCTTENASKWINRQTYGTGFRLDGASAAEDFLPVNTFRPFSSWTNREPLMPVAGSVIPIFDDTLSLTLAIHVPPNQADGDYKQTIRLLAVPKI